MVQVKKIIRALFFNKKAYDELKGDKNALIPGLIFVLLFSLASVFSTELNPQTLPLIVVSSLFYIIYWSILAGIISLVPQLFGGKSSFDEYLRVFNYAAIPFTLGLIPVIGFIANIWGIAYIILATKEVYGLRWPKIINGTIMLLIVSFFITAVMVPYLIKPYGSIDLPGMTLVSKPVKEGLSNFQVSRITVNDKITESVSYGQYVEKQRQCIENIARDLSPGQIYEHTFLLSPTAKESTIKSITITKDKKTCCVYADDLGKTIQPGFGAVGKGFVQVDAICTGRDIGGGLYDLEITISYETTEKGITSSYTDTGHVKGPNPIF